METLEIKNMDSWLFTKSFIKLNGQNATAEHKGKITCALLLWEQQKDFRSVDKMAAYCAQNNILMTFEMVQAVGELATLRLNDKLKISEKNFAYKDVKYSVFLEMWKMICYCSTSEDKAAINGTKILKFRSKTDVRIKPTKPNTLKKEFRKWRVANQDFISGMLKQTPSWREEDIKAYLNQYDLIALEEWEVGELR
tara:strand:- start:3013 stop:3600 length:588 start_codon:yes stop_codon:yes gene_type:complete